MGGGRPFKYPKWVWSPAGGWWANPPNANRNLVAYLVFVVAPLSYFVYGYSERHTVMHIKQDLKLYVIVS